MTVRQNRTLTLTLTHTLISPFTQRAGVDKIPEHFAVLRKPRQKSERYSLTRLIPTEPLRDTVLLDKHLQNVREITVLLD